MRGHHVARSVRGRQHCDQSVLATRCRSCRYGGTRLALHLPRTPPTKTFRMSEIYGPLHISTAGITLHLTPKQADVH